MKTITRLHIESFIQCAMDEEIADVKVKRVVLIFDGAAGQGSRV